MSSSDENCCTSKALVEDVQQAREILMPDPDDIYYPMDVRTYKAILTHKNTLPHVQHSLQRIEMMDQGVSRKEDVQLDPEFGPEQLALRRDLAKGKVRWWGSWWKDHWAFQRNNHPLLAMCCSHPLFPVSRKEFYVIFGVNFFFALSVSALAMDAAVCVACDVGCGKANKCYFQEVDLPLPPRMANGERPVYYQNRSRLNCANATEDNTSDVEQCNSTSGDYGQPLPTGFAIVPWDLRYDHMQTLKTVREEPNPSWCCVSEAVGIQWFIQNLYIGEQNFGKFLYCMLVGILYMVIFFNLMQCNPVQDRKAKVRHRAEVIGHIVVGILAAIIIFGFLPYTIMYLWRQGLLIKTAILLIISKLGGWVCVFFVKTLLFSCAFRAQRSAKGFYVTDRDYQEYVERQSSGSDDF